jgi:hypothetical protein
MVPDLMDRGDMDYRRKTYTNMGYTKSRRRVGSDLYCGKTPKEERMDVLGLFSRAYAWARDLLGEGLGINKPGVLLCTYSASNSWLY